MLRVTFKEPTLLNKNRINSIECDGLKFNDRITKEYIICLFDYVEIYRFKYKDLIYVKQINPFTKEVLINQ